MITEGLVALVLGGGWGYDARVSVMVTRESAAPTILCPAYPSDPPWRPMTCYILTKLGEPPDRKP